MRERRTSLSCLARSVILSRSRLRNTLYSSTKPLVCPFAILDVCILSAFQRSLARSWATRRPPRVAVFAVLPFIACSSVLVVTANFIVYVSPGCAPRSLSRQMLELHGGRDALVNIKYVMPTYESCQVAVQAPQAW